MMNAASTSNPSCIVEVGEASASDPRSIFEAGEASTSDPRCIVEVGVVYPYPSHVIAPNFVTMKLSGKDTYNVWETQILCLLKSHHMYGFIDGQFPSPAVNGKGKVGDIDAWIASDSLVKGWILGSLSDGVAKKVVNRLRTKDKKTDFSAKDLWDELQRNYGPWVVAETKEATRQAESQIMEEKVDEVFADSIYKDILGNTIDVIDQLERNGNNPWDKLMNNGDTVLHVAVGSSTKNNLELLKKLLEMTPPEKLNVTNSDGSTLLHVAAIGGNTEIVDMLVRRNPELLLAKDKEGHTPLALSVSNMHIKTSECLFKHMIENGYGSYFSGESGEEIVVLAISCQDFWLANRIIEYSYKAILNDSDAMLTALAQNFPRELNFWEPVDGLRDWNYESYRRYRSYAPTMRRLENFLDWPCGRQLFGLADLILRYFLIGFSKLRGVYISFLFVLASRGFVKDTFRVHQDAKRLLNGVCNLISEYKGSSSNHVYYTKSIFEATRRNSSAFIRRIMWQYPNAIWNTNEEGHNFIQYSVINRSEKIYNLLYEMSEHKNIYKTIKDSFGNNLLHLAARLSPPKKLNQITGPALQTQRELQWFKEVERFVCPLNRIQKNSDDETPEEVFTREHKGLVIEGEKWIKKTANSYTITTALIITIVFAAAITVPGGNNQESGIPIFTNDIAFTVFAISDAISLFTAVTSLVIFLSILTTECFEEQDFLCKLPTKLIIGLTMLFLSTTAMIIAFGATLFLVFGQSNSSMLIPIGAFTCLPIMSFVTLQFPLIVELIRATYCGGFFVREEFEYFY